MTLRVRDLPVVQEWLKEKGVGSRQVDDQLGAADRADTHGAPYFFTTEGVRGNPLDRAPGR